MGSYFFERSGGGFNVEPSSCRLGRRYHRRPRDRRSAAGVTCHSVSRRPSGSVLSGHGHKAIRFGRKSTVCFRVTNSIDPHSFSMGCSFKASWSMEFTGQYHSYPARVSHVAFCRCDSLLGEQVRRIERFSTERSVCRKEQLVLLPYMIWTSGQSIIWPTQLRRDTPK